MKKLVQGIIDFRKNVRPGVRDTFAKLALGQSPDSLFIACSDSRVVPNLFASTDPGDLFVVRNVGNLVPKSSGPDGMSSADESEAAAIEFAVATLGVKDVIICGHSECGAMQALIHGREQILTPNLKAWLRHGDDALKMLNSKSIRSSTLAPHNHLSQLNVLHQIENLRSYPLISDRVKTGKLRLHAWWFELANASVHTFDTDSKSFVEFDESNSETIFKSL